MLSDFTSKKFHVECLASVVSALGIVIACISFAGLVFAGNLVKFLPFGIGLTLASAVVLGIVTVFTSSYKLTLAFPQDKPAAIFGLAASGIASTLAPEGDHAVLSTVLVTLSLTSLVTGMCIAFVGYARLGALVRYVPYPVIGGFLAGTGWLVFEGALGLTSGFAIRLDPTALELLSPKVIPHWGVALAFGGVLFLAIKMTKKVVLLPVGVVAGFIAFYLVCEIAGITTEQAHDSGWLVRTFPEEGVLTPVWSVIDWHAVHWDQVWPHAGTIVAIALVSVITVLLNVTGLELATGSEINLDRELRSNGVANVLAAGVGGMVGYSTISLPVLNARIGVTSRLTGLLTVSFVAMSLFFGDSLLTHIPVPVMGGLLFLIALDFLCEWLWDARKKFGWADYVLIWSITVMIGMVGFLPGVALGILAAVVLYAFDSSKRSFAKNELTAGSFRSNVERSNESNEILDRFGQEVLILQLQGYLFFGTTNSLLNRLADRVHKPDRATPRYIILDFRLVTGLDSSVLFSFTKLKRLAEVEKVTICLAGLGADARRALAASTSLLESESGVFRIFPDLDHAAEWCENQVIQAALPKEKRRPLSIDALVCNMLGDAELAKRLLRHLLRLELKMGDYLLRQGGPCDGLYFVESGSLSITVEQQPVPDMRIRKVKAGVIVGEMSVYTGMARAASVIADEATVVYHLAMTTLQTLERKDAELGGALHRGIASILARRLLHADNGFRALLT